MSPEKLRVQKSGRMNAPAFSLIFWLHSHLRFAGRLSWLFGTDTVRTHHFVILVLHDMTMPDELSGRIKMRMDTCDLTRVGNDSILQSILPGFGRAHFAS